MGAGLADDDPAVGVADQDGRAVEAVEDPAGHRGVVLQRQRRVLHDVDAEVVPGQLVVDALPAGSVHEATVYEHDVLDGCHGRS